MTEFGLNGFDYKKQNFNEFLTKGFIVTKEHLISLGVKEKILNIDNSFIERPIDTILTAGYDAVELVYHDVHNNTLLAARKGELCGLITLTGAVVIPLEYYNIDAPINTGTPVFCVRNTRYQWGAISLSGEVVIPFGEYSYLWGYENGLCLVGTKKYSSQRAIVDTRNNFVVDFDEYLHIKNFRGKNQTYIEVRTNSQTIRLSISDLANEHYSKYFDEIPSFTSSNLPVSSYSEYYNEDHYGMYAGSYAQDVMGYSDDTISDAFEGDPDAYWNID